MFLPKTMLLPLPTFIATPPIINFPYLPEPYLQEPLTLKELLTISSSPTYKNSPSIPDTWLLW